MSDEIIRKIKRELCINCGDRCCCHGIESCADVNKFMKEREERKMIDYEFFYYIAEHGNANWKGNFSSKEIAKNAYDYLTEFEYSKVKGNYHVSSTIQEILYLLDEDNSEECNYWASEIRYELGLNQPLRVHVEDDKIYIKDGLNRLIENLQARTKIIIELK